MDSDSSTSSRICATHFRNVDDEDTGCAVLDAGYRGSLEASVPTSPDPAEDDHQPY